MHNLADINLQSYLESRLTMDLSEEDTRTLLHRIRSEAGSHHFFAQVVRKVSS